MTAWMRRLAFLILLPVLAACAVPVETAQDAHAAFDQGSPGGPLSGLALGVVDGDSMRFANNVLGARQGLFRMGPMGVDGAADADPQQIPADLGRALGARFRSARPAASVAEAVARGDDVVLVVELQVQLGYMSFDITTIGLTGAFQGRDGAPLGKFSGNGQFAVPFPASSSAVRPAWVAALADFMRRVDGASGSIASLSGQHRGAPPVAVAAPGPKASVPVAPPVVAVAPPRFPAQALALSFHHAPERPDDVAVIIGNADYGRFGKDIPDVKPAYADAEGMKAYATQGLGIREGNIIDLKDATGAQMVRVFGNDKDYRGQLFDWVKPGKSRVFVYYAGHGAPGGQGGSPYLVPVDADAARIELNGFPLKTLYDNLARLPAESVTVVLEACFSGQSAAGSVLGQASPVYFDVKPPPVPEKLTVITAGSANQVASWEQDGSDGLFTKYFLLGMSGKADAAPHGNGDGKVGLDELDRYLKDTLTYWARRYYGRDQQARIVRGGLN